MLNKLFLYLYKHVNKKYIYYFYVNINMAFYFIYAGLWGFIGTSSLIIGAILGYYFNIPKKISSSLLAFSAGILISAVCFEILFDSYKYGGLLPTIIGFILGMIIFTIVDIIILHLNIESRKNNMLAPKDANIIKYEYSSLNRKILNLIIYKFKKPYNKYQVRSLITITSVLFEAIPDAIAIGLILIIGGPISIALIISIFLANLFEGLSSVGSMKLGNWSKKLIFGVWIFVILLSFISAMLAYIIFSNTDQHILSLALGISAGAILSIIADLLLPEAFNETKEFTGTLLALGFLLSFILSHLT